MFMCGSHKSDNNVYTSQIAILFCIDSPWDNNWQSYHEISNKT